MPLHGNSRTQILYRLEWNKYFLSTWTTKAAKAEKKQKSSVRGTERSILRHAHTHVDTK